MFCLLYDDMYIFIYVFVIDYLDTVIVLFGTHATFCYSVILLPVQVTGIVFYETVSGTEAAGRQ